MPRFWSRLTPLVRGRLVERCRCEGKEVTTGERLARLDDREAQATLKDLRALESFSLQESERQTTLRNLQRNSTQTRDRLTALERDEARLNDLLANLERARRSAGGSATPAGTGLTTSDLGRLDWPVEGSILYQFGREQLANGGVIRRNGIGIGAPKGTPVKAVADGTVALRDRLGTYGLTLIVEHGSGYWAVYGQLASASVAVGDRITSGQVIGTVGGEGSDSGSHLYLEIRGENQIALDPLTWLRRK